MDIMASLPPLTPYNKTSPKTLTMEQIEANNRRVPKEMLLRHNEA